MPLADVAAEARIGDELGIVELAVGDDLVADADLGRQPAGDVELAPGERLGRRGHRERPLTQRPIGERRHDRRVDAAREGDENRTTLGEPRGQVVDSRVGR